MSPSEIVNKMMALDYFSQWLGISVEAISDGHCILKMKIRKEMLNGFAIAHGGITYSLADSALAFASNSKGSHALSIETSISHIRSLEEGDEIVATAECESNTNKLGYYKVLVKRGDELVALFKGIVYKTSRRWDH